VNNKFGTDWQKEKSEGRDIQMWTGQKAHLSKNGLVKKEKEINVNAIRNVKGGGGGIKEKTRFTNSGLQTQGNVRI
jgi:hypothetical protein